MPQKDFLDSVIKQAAEKSDALEESIFLDFLEPVLQKFSEKEISRYPHNDCRFFGGHLYCERKMMCICQKDAPELLEEYPIAPLHIKTPKGALIAHKDVLGAVLGLGIERDKIGDINIIPESNLIQLFVSKPLGEFFVENLNEISRYSVETKLCDFSDIICIEPNFTSLSVIIPSMRLDVLIHSVYKLSRTEASAFVKGEKVFINHSLSQKPSVNLKSGDIVSVRTKGRFIVDDIAGNTKKGNIRLNIRKFE